MGVARQTLGYYSLSVRIHPIGKREIHENPDPSLHPHAQAHYNPRKTLVENGVLPHAHRKPEQEGNTTPKGKGWVRRGGDVDQENIGARTTIHV